MNLISLDTAASLELIGRYATAEDKVLQYRRELTPLFVKAQQHLGQVPLTLAWLDIAHANLRRSRGDLILRREWFIRADSAAAGAYEGWQELAPLSANRRSWQDLGSLLSSHEDLSDEELSSLLEEIAARSLVFPAMAADLLAQLGPRRVCQHRRANNAEAGKALVRKRSNSRISSPARAFYARGKCFARSCRHSARAGRLSHADRRHS